MATKKKAVKKSASKKRTAKKSRSGSSSSELQRRMSALEARVQRLEDVVGPEGSPI